MRVDRRTGQIKNLSPWPRYMEGNASADTKYRFGWTHPIFFSPSNPKELLVGSQVVFSSADLGQTWTVLSPDLTRNVRAPKARAVAPSTGITPALKRFPTLLRWPRRRLTPICYGPARLTAWYT